MLDMTYFLADDLNVSLCNMEKWSVNYVFLDIHINSFYPIVTYICTFICNLFKKDLRWKFYMYLFYVGMCVSMFLCVQMHIHEKDRGQAQMSSSETPSTSL